VSLRTVARALPSVFKVGLAEMTAYRAEMLVWILSTTMPLVMLALWNAVARAQPIGNFGQREFAAYFMVTFIVRQLATAWIGWQMNYEVRHGTLSMRLLRPFPPILSYAVENLASMPMRLVLVVPIAVGTLAVLGPGFLPRDPVIWVMVPFALVGAWCIAFLSSFAIGALSLYTQSSMKILDVWFTFFTLTSGYLFPIEILPPGARAVIDALPFRFQLAYPVELLNTLHSRESAARLLAGQWAYVAVFGLLAWVVWRGGVRRYGAYGG
jgi:ABC-2 type transport system permease protein